jgi:glycolate oxidase iron-sulfur subunit
MSDTPVSKCGKCGLCLAVCPVHRLLMEEQASPRARIQLIENYKRKKLPSSPYLKELINKCLMCGSCAANCPSGVDHYSQFMEMRQQMAKEHGDRLEIKSLVYLLAKEQRLRLAVGMAKLGRSIVPEIFQKKYRLGNIPIHNFPQLNKKPFRSTIPEEIPAKGKERGIVLYFTGCATNYIYDETGHATLELLTTMGYRVRIPRQQTCCSIPMLYHGGIEEARKNIEQNLQCFDEDDVAAIIVDCPTCGSALKKEFPSMMKKWDKDSGPAEAIGAKVTDLMSFIYDRRDSLRIDEQKAAAAGPVTYHAPCHLKNCFVPADRLLRDLPFIDFIEADDALDCCGGGGTFFYEYPEISTQMASKKIAGAKKTGASLWLTDCPVCRINLSGRLTAEDNIDMLHPARYLALILKQ